MKKSLGEENYEQFADRYAARIESKPHNAYLERPATLSLLPDVTGLRVLDAGCGPGIYAEWLLERGADVVCCDVTPAMIELAKQRVGEQVEFQLADLSQPLDFAKDEEFDVVLCPLVLDYIEDFLPTFREFNRVLKPGGILVVSCGHPASDFFVYFNAGNYFDIEKTEMPWGGFGTPKPVVKAYRRGGDCGIFSL